MGKVDFLFKVLYVLLRECVIPLNVRIKIYNMMEQYGYYMEAKDDKCCVCGTQATKEMETND